MSILVLGVKIDDVSKAEALKRVEKWLKTGGKYYIVTPNPEFLIAAQKDEEFKRLLNCSDLAIPDGAGLKLTGQIKNTTTGIDFMEELCSKAAQSGWKVGLIGGRDDVAAKAAECLLRKYPRLKITFTSDGGNIDENGKIVGRGESKKPYNFQFLIPNSDLLFIAFGMLKQERWIVDNMKIVNAKVFMGVGGAFDYISGKLPRAPVWMRVIGLEWLFRLILQPWRIKRQIALLKFIYLVLTNKSN